MRNVISTRYGIVVGSDSHGASQLPRRTRAESPQIYSPAMHRRPGMVRPRGLQAGARRVLTKPLATIVALPAALFVLASCLGLSNPGLQYDELLFANAALGNSHPYHGFIYRETLGITTMVMPYIGALKSWLYAPIF